MERADLSLSARHAAVLNRGARRLVTHWGRPSPTLTALFLILDRNLFHVVDNHNAAGTSLRNQLQTKSILDGVYEGRSGRSVVRYLPDQVSPVRAFQEPSHIDGSSHIDVVLLPESGSVDYRPAQVARQRIEATSNDDTSAAWP